MIERKIWIMSAIFTGVMIILICLMSLSHASPQRPSIHQMNLDYKYAVAMARHYRRMRMLYRMNAR